MFSDASKFEKIYRDPTLTRRNSPQRYLSGLLNKGKISEQEKKDMRPMAAQLFLLITGPDSNVDSEASSRLIRVQSKSGFALPYSWPIINWIVA